MRTCTSCSIPMAGDKKVPESLLAIPEFAFEPHRKSRRLSFPQAAVLLSAFVFLLAATQSVQAASTYSSTTGKLVVVGLNVPVLGAWDIEWSSLSDDPD